MIKISAFTGDPVLDPFYAVKWCIEHDYIQQAYILLSEHVITVFCKLLAVDDQSFECREAVRRGIRIGGKYSQAEWEKHYYIQQAYILLSEHVITVFCKLLAVDDQSFECREAVRRESGWR